MSCSQPHRVPARLAACGHFFLSHRHFFPLQRYWGAKDLYFFCFISCGCCEFGKLARPLLRDELPWQASHGSSREAGMNAIENLTSSGLGNVTSNGRSSRAAANAGQFDEILNTVSSYRNDDIDEPEAIDDEAAYAEDEPVDDVQAHNRRSNSQHDDQADTAVAQSEAAITSAMKTTPKDADATMLQVAVKGSIATNGTKGTSSLAASTEPNGTAAATAGASEKQAKAGTQGQSVSAIQRPGVETPAELPAPGAALKLDAQLTQDSAGLTSRPLSTLIKDATNGGLGDSVAPGENIRTAADQKFAAGKNALERQADIKSDLQDPKSDPSGERASGKRSTFAERMTELTERLAQRAQGLDTTPTARHTPVSGTAVASANQPAISTLRSGDLPFTMSGIDASVDTAQAVPLSGNRIVQTGNAANQIAARTPQAPPGTPADQVSVQIQHGLRNESDRISVRLSPASLGKVEVKLEVSPDRTVHAIVTAERPETLDMLARDARTLQRALEDAGLQTNSNSLSFQRNDDGGSAAQQFADRQSRTAMTDDSGSPDRNGFETVPTDTPQSNQRAAHDGMLDVEI
jgi:flagellar hook-length control protein FliK